MVAEVEWIDTLGRSIGRIVGFSGQQRTGAVEDAGQLLSGPGGIGRFQRQHIEYDIGSVIGVLDGVGELPRPYGDLIVDGIREATQVERSEEHTSELQSLMRISYAVFCLKKKVKKFSYSPSLIQLI